MTRNPWCRVDPSLPDVADADVHCTHCGQSLETICDGLGFLPTRHYVRPTFIHGQRRLVIRTGDTHSYHYPSLCPMTRDDLTTLIYRAQRAKAGLGPSGLCNEPAATDRSVA